MCEKLIKAVRDRTAVVLLSITSKYCAGLFCMDSRERNDVVVRKKIVPETLVLGNSGDSVPLEE